MTDAPLHPRRITAALNAIALECSEDEKVFDSSFVETFEAALKMLQKAQRATGLTPEVADVGSHVLGVLDYVKKGLARK